jgi:E3 ubiquitin-protein ligase RGLG
VFSIDFTKSNTWQGEKTFGGLCLHHLSHIPGEFNPYQQVISTLSDVLLKKLDDDMEIPLYGFGDSHTSNKKVFLMNNEKPCHSKEELLAAYADAASNVILSGPTSFAPIIYEAIDVCKATSKYHILFIVADGMMDDVDATTQAIVAASKHPLSIVMVGVGDGDDGKWDQMDTFDDDIPNRDFDNFQFVSMTRLVLHYRDPSQRALRFATEALMELPEQYGLIKKAGLLGRAPDHRVQFVNRLRGKHHFPSSFQEAGARREGSPGAAPPAYAPVY